VIPTLNEANSISGLLNDILGLKREFDVIVVDDQSTDGTPSVVSSLALTHPGRIHLLERKHKENGLAGAYLAGYRFASAHKYEWIFQMDGDGQHNPRNLEDLWSRKSKQSLVVGSRYCEGGEVSGWNRRRLIVSKLGNLYFRILHRPGISDCTGGFKLIHISSLDNIWKNPPRSSGFTFHAETTYRAVKNGISIVEVPIIFSVRKADNSKMKFSSGLESLKEIALWKLKK